ncbi:TetR-like C-terminal domain-containing protein [Occultella kanbiaonis]|uniref:TetR-like C-terminal domain-containing protein n=1 Tax=Occultella kanbiaonis TaxID=2675754 RepID=UPI001A980318
MRPDSGWSADGGRWTVELGRAADAATAALLAAVTAGQRSGELPAGDPVALAELLRATAHGAVELELGGHLAKGDSTTTPADLLGRLLSLLAQ